MPYVDILLSLCLPPSIYHLSVSSLCLSLCLHCSHPLPDCGSDIPTTIIIWPSTVSKVQPQEGKGDSSGKVGRKRQPFFLKLWFEGTWPFDIKPEKEAISRGTFTKLYKDPESDDLGYNHEPNPRHPVNLEHPSTVTFHAFFFLDNNETMLFVKQK